MKNHQRLLTEALGLTQSYTGGKVLQHPLDNPKC